MIDWLNDQQVVEAWADSTPYRALKPAACGIESIAVPDSQRWAIGFGVRYISRWFPTKELAWRHARFYPRVRDWEYRNNPAYRKEA